MSITAPEHEDERPGPGAISPGAGRWDPVSADGPRVVDAILAGHAVPPPVPEAASAELREILARAEARAGL
jgi:hypothetical protein